MIKMKIKKGKFMKEEDFIEKLKELSKKGEVKVYAPYKIRFMRPAYGGIKMRDGSIKKLNYEPLPEGAIGIATPGLLRTPNPAMIEAYVNTNTDKFKVIASQLPLERVGVGIEIESKDYKTEDKKELEEIVKRIIKKYF